MPLKSAHFLFLSLSFILHLQSILNISKVLGNDDAWIQPYQPKRFGVGESALSKGGVFILTGCSVSAAHDGIHLYSLSGFKEALFLMTSSKWSPAAILD